MKYFAGIGSRKTPELILSYMRKVAQRLATHEFTLRSGAADGADKAFEEGCIKAKGQSEVWLPWKGFNNHSDTGLLPTEEHFLRAQEVHPAWERLTRGPRALHARNVGQIFGMDLQTPVSFVLCWTEDGCCSEAARTSKTGGTGTAIVLADRAGIPVFNLGNQDGKSQLNAFMAGHLHGG